MWHPAPFCSRLVFAVAISASMQLAAQSADPRLAAADRLFAERNAAGALATYDSAAASHPASYEALWKASRSATDLGEFEPSRPARDSLFSRARGYAQRAVQADSADAEGYFQLARAIGRVALAAGVTERVHLSVEVRADALRALALNPQHPGALHVLGMWNAEIMRLNGVSRMVAKTFLGGGVMSEASWDAAVRDLEQAVAVEPDRIVHHLDLAAVYRDIGRKDDARAHYQWIARAPVTDFNDANYKQVAAAALRGINK